MRLQQNCQFCNQRLVLLNKIILDDNSTFINYRCDHFTIEPPKVTLKLDRPIKSLDGSKELYNYQYDGVEFGLNTQFNCLIADQMGLGKTVQALEFIPQGLSLPCLAIVRGATIWQWAKTYREWIDNKKLSVFVIQGSKSFIPPGFDLYIISMDTFSRMVNIEVLLNTSRPYYATFKQSTLGSIEIALDLRGLGIKSIIADECQSFKAQSSKRSKALVGFISELQIKEKIFLSGTPIKNKADEYFTILNLLKPNEFSSIEKFRKEWLVQDHKGKWSSVSPYRQEEFRKLISDFVIRRELKDVVKDLPTFRRTFETISIEDEKWARAYNFELAELQSTVGESGKIRWTDVNEHLMKLRRICGMAKVDFAVDYVDVFLETSPENEKICLGIHHRDVRDALFYKLSERVFNPLKLSGEDNSNEKEKIKNEFINDPSKRVLIMNMLAGGVGLDGLDKVCNYILCLERQWNSVDEEQFEQRFYGRGLDPSKSYSNVIPTVAEYMLAKDSIDDFFTQLVERKRQIFKDVVGNDWNLASDDGMLRELVEQTMYKRL